MSMTNAQPVVEAPAAARPPEVARGVPLLGALPRVALDPLMGLTAIAHEHSGAVVKVRFGPLDFYMLTSPRQVAHVLCENWK